MNPTVLHMKQIEQVLLLKYAVIHTVNITENFASVSEIKNNSHAKA